MFLPICNDSGASWTAVCTSGRLSKDRCHLTVGRIVRLPGRQALVQDRAGLTKLRLRPGEPRPEWLSR